MVSQGCLALSECTIIHCQKAISSANIVPNPAAKPKEMLVVQERAWEMELWLLAILHSFHLLPGVKGRPAGSCRGPGRVQWLDDIAASVVFSSFHAQWALSTRHSVR